MRKKDDKIDKPIEDGRPSNNHAGNEGVDYSQTDSKGETDILNDEERVIAAGSSVNITGNPQLLNEPVPERVLTSKTVDLEEKGPLAPTINNNEQQKKEAVSQPGFSATSNQQENSFNSGFNATGPNTESTAGPQAKQSVPKGNNDPNLQTAKFLLLKLREGVQALGNIMGIKKSTINKLHDAGKINKNLPLQIVGPTGAAEYAPLEKVIDIHNANIAQPYQEIISEDVIEENAPLVALVIQKKGAAMTPEQQLGLNGLIIGGMLVVNMYQSYKMNKEFTNSLQLLHKSSLSNSQAGPIIENAHPASVAEPIIKQPVGEVTEEKKLNTSDSAGVDKRLQNNQKDVSKVVDKAVSRGRKRTRTAIKK